MEGEWMGGEWMGGEWMVREGKERREGEGKGSSISIENTEDWW